MSSKIIFLVVLILTVGIFIFTDLHSEIIDISDLNKGQKEKKEFSIERDIFSPFKGSFSRRPKEKIELPLPVKPEKKVEEGIKDKADEIRESVAFEGYVIRKAKKLALLTINGEFFVVGKDDIVLDKIKIKKVDKKNVTIEIDSNVFEIKLKGDDDNGEF